MPGPDRPRRWLRPLLLAAPLLFLGAFFLYPLARLLAASLTREALFELLQGRVYREVIWFTIWQAALSTLLTLLAGLPAAYLFARFTFPGKALLRALVTVPFVLPTVVVAAAFRALLGRAGPLNALLGDLLPAGADLLQFEHGLGLILLAHVFYNVAVVIRLVGGFWAGLSPGVAEAARVLGADRRRVFLLITLPLLRPAVLSAGILTYLFTFTSFGVILILGGPAFSTIETEIYRQYVTFLRPDIAAGLSAVQIIFTSLLMVTYGRWQRRAALPLEFRPQRLGARQPAGALERGLLTMGLAGLALFMLSPLAALALRSVTTAEGAFTLAYYAALPTLRRGSVTFIPPLAAVANSLVYGLLTLLAAGALGLLSAWLASQSGRWRRPLEALLMLPLGASAVTLGFGYVISLGGLRTSPLIVLIAHTLVALPFVVRAVTPVLQGIRPALRESAALLGASPWQVWRQVDLPIVGRALLVGAVFAFTISVGEFGATSFIVRPNSGFLTLPIAIERYLGQPGALNFGQALAMSTVLMLVCVVAFVAIERFRYADIGEF
ncbi:MAG: ABC transporter permease [Candidatus Promineifilaceae bacterium]